MHIFSKEEAEENKRNAPVNKVQDGDALDITKINGLPHPLLARFCGDTCFYEIETIDVQTGLLRFLVCGLVDRGHFSSIMELKDVNGDIHEPDTFWVDYDPTCSAPDTDQDALSSKENAE